MLPINRAEFTGYHRSYRNPTRQGGIGVIRVSGTLAPSIAEALVGQLLTRLPPWYLP